MPEIEHSKLAVPFDVRLFLDMARVCRAIYPGPTNQKILSHNGARFENQRFIHGALGRGYCRIFSNEQTVTIAFRGTRGKVDWLISNLRCWPEWLRDCEDRARWIPVHRGFQRTLEYNDKTTKRRNLDAALAALEDMNVGSRDLYITGHSLGAACAILFAAKLRHKHPELVARNLKGIVLFGSPAVGGFRFHRHFGRLNDLTVRLINGSDIVPFAPPIGYVHVGKGYWLKPTSIRPDPGWPTRLYRALFFGRPSRYLGDHSMTAYIERLRSELVLHGGSSA